MASKEKIERAKRHFENPALLEKIQSGVLAPSYEYALVLADALTAAEEELDSFNEAHKELAEACQEYIEAVDPNYIGDMPSWFIVNAALHTTETEVE